MFQSELNPEANYQANAKPLYGGSVLSVVMGYGGFFEAFGLRLAGALWFFSSGKPAWQRSRLGNRPALPTVEIQEIHL